MLEDFGDAMASGSRDLARELNDAAYGVGRFRRIVVLGGQGSIRPFGGSPMALIQSTNLDIVLSAEAAAPGSADHLVRDAVRASRGASELGSLRGATSGTQRGGSVTQWMRTL